MIQSWGNDGRLVNRRLELSATSVRLSSLTYAYDNNDNFTAINDTLDPTKSRTYAYDAMDRIRRITGTPGPFAREDFIYDKNGNRLRVERRATATAATPIQTETYTLAANTNRLTSLTTAAGTYRYSHDGRGNQSTETWPDGSVIQVAYDGFARLTRYKVGLATQDMLYNGDDERIRVVTTPAVGPADTRIYMYDLDNRIVAEYGGAGVSDVKAEYIWTLPEVGAAGPTGGDDGAGGYMPLAIVTGATADINWVHAHHNAKPILLTNAAGTVVPYQGIAVLGFPGQFANAVGLAGAQYYYNRYRDYNDATGRYIQADPIGLAGDDNPYAYANGNALRYTDPTGEFVPLAIAAGILIGAGTDLGLQLLTNGGNLGCVNWFQVGFSGALGAFGGEILVPTLRLTKGSMMFANVSRRIRRAENLVGKRIDLHHGILPRSWENLGSLARNIVNHPANLRAMPRRAHQALHASRNPFSGLAGLPAWAQGGLASIGVGATAEASKGN
jgi:RHS repeat-associated protein